ncbi:MAG: protoheme IX farnesyltransferase [Flavobacteriales bacterium]|nr:protoheme IX farnesyltransferase [Flavobacteriales bacterium]
MGKIKDYSEFLKLRLASLVVLSSVICYALAAAEFNVAIMGALVVGGTLLTGASNGFNEIIERDLDALMDRTKQRPLPTSKMTITEAWIAAILFGAMGVGILWYFINPMSGILGLAAMFLYAVVYTPMKQKTPFAVFVGAFPGSIPPMLGCVAATEGFGQITLLSLLMFSVQFIWQFPHFWAIAWRVHDDYLKAGFKMLPSAGGRDKGTAFQIVVYTIGLIPVSLLPTFFGYTGAISAIVAVIAGIIFTKQAFDLYRTLSADDAKRLMFGSFFYLPIVQLAYLLDKV